MGRTDGVVLTIGAITISDAINLACACGTHRVWRPVMGGSQKESKQRNNYTKRKALDST